jgi:putative tryptophan/tyrosine transport system substrate-binding protein
MDRRAFLGTLAGSALAAPLAAGAQARRVWRIAWLVEGRNPGRESQVPWSGRWFFDALRELGYIEGQNLSIDYRFAEERADQLAELAAEILRQNVDLIAVIGTREALAAKAATSTIPIVTLFVGDPVGSGLVNSLNAPGGNLTGTSVMYADVGGQRLGLLKELVPKLRSVGILGNPKNVSAAADIRASEVAGRSLGIDTKSVGMVSRDHLDEALDQLARHRIDGLLIIQDALIVAVQRQIADFALRYRLPSVTPARMYVETGSLLSYGPDMRATARRAATYVDRIFRGAKPSDLPIEQPTTFELLINLKTAKALGLTIPASLLARADQVIE